MPVKGDYVLATKYEDGDPADHWFVGIYSHQTNDRHHVVDSNGHMPRQNGFRRVERITEEEGKWILNNTELRLAEFETQQKSVWDFLAEIRPPTQESEARE